MKKHLVITAIIIANSAAALVPKKLLVEHFTNTLCSVCASRNPGFMSNLNMQVNPVYLRFHPSAPYSACILNQVDKTGNDDRCKAYNMYGSTPRLAINGNPISANSNYNSSALFAPYLNEESSFEIKTSQLKSNNSLIVRITIIKRDTSSLVNGNLYVAALEDSLKYNAPNGEQLHTSTYRKAFTSVSGQSVVLPSAINDSLVLYFTTTLNQSWNTKMISAIAILKSNTGTYIQSTETDMNQSDQTLSINSNMKENTYKIYPNPSSNFIEINGTDDNDNFEIVVYGFNGKELFRETGNSTLKLDISGLTVGIYIIEIKSETRFETMKFVKE